MINSIIDGISIKLNQVFGDEYEIYSENVEQGLKEPCFFILPLVTMSSPKLGRRIFREFPFDVHYFPINSDEQRKEMNSVAERLMNDLEYVTVNGDLIRGTKMSSEIINGVLHLFVYFNMFVLKPAELEEEMESLSINGTTRGDKIGY